LAILFYRTLPGAFDFLIFDLGKMKTMNANFKWKIVLIDDEADIREVVSLVLTDAGFIVETAENGTAGIELCKTFCPQIVITDIRMPGMDGLAVLEHLKKRSSDIEVIVITAFGELDFAIRALQLDASDFITKPVSENAIHLALKRAMERYLSRKKLKEYARFLEQENVNQAKLLHRDKLISLGRLSASVVHEINNPVAGILNYARLMLKMLKQGGLSEHSTVRFTDHLTLVASEAERISTIISSLLTFSRKTDFTISRVLIDELVERSLVLARHRLELAGIGLTVNVEQGIPGFKGDFNLLQQCLINLVFNAVDAMERGGLLELSASFCPETKRVLIKVSDSGVGIAPEDLDHIFEPFFTTKDEGHGVGLGLSIVFGIMERHRGGVTVHSQPGRGSAFTLEIPV
jgi:signal transduction histidine kinase